MAEVRNVAVFPVVLFIQERQIYCGNVEIRPALNFEQFRTLLNEMIGASYFHLSACIIDDRRPEIPIERRKILVAGKVTSLVLGQEKNFSFFVELPPAPELAPGDMFLIHLNHLRIIDPPMSTFRTHHYEGRFHDLHTQSSNNINRIWNSTHRSIPPVNENVVRIREAESAVQGGRRRELCEECRMAETQGKTPPFHHCVYDDVIYGFFRSPAGPVGRFKLYR